MFYLCKYKRGVKIKVKIKSRHEIFEENYIFKQARGFGDKFFDNA